MNNYYKRMYVLSEEEYKRLKLIQRVPPIAATVEEPFTAITDEEPKTADGVMKPPPPELTTTRYACSICSKTYKQKRDLRRHVQTTHKPPTKAIILQRTPSIESDIVIQKKPNTILQRTPSIDSDVIVLKNKVEKTKKKQKRKQKIERVEAFEKVKKWMTMRN